MVESGTTPDSLSVYTIIYTIHPVVSGILFGWGVGS